MTAHRLRPCVLAALVALVPMGALPAIAQPAAKPTGQPPRAAAPAKPAARPSGPPLFHVSGFFTLGYQEFAAADTFDATLGKTGGGVMGGGGSLTHRSGLFAQVDLTRFTAEGERAFVYDSEVFKLGIPLSVEVRPIEFTFGYKFFTRPPKPRPTSPAKPASAKPDPKDGDADGAHFAQARPAAPTKPATPVAARPAARAPLAGLRPYVGAGFGLVRYTETSDFAGSGEDVDESFTSYHVTGGLEIPIWKWIGAAAEFNLRWVGDAFGEAGLSKEFGEDDLGGPSFRVKITVGR